MSRNIEVLNIYSCPVVNQLLEFSSRRRVGRRVAHADLLKLRVQMGHGTLNSVLARCTGPFGALGILKRRKGGKQQRVRLRPPHVAPHGTREGTGAFPGLSWQPWGSPQKQRRRTGPGRSPWEEGVRDGAERFADVLDVGGEGEPQEGMLSDWGQEKSRF